MKHRFSGNFVGCSICPTYSCVSGEFASVGSLGWCRSGLFCSKWTMARMGVGKYVVVEVLVLLASLA